VVYKAPNNSPKSQYPAYDLLQPLQSSTSLVSLVEQLILNTSV